MSGKNKIHVVVSPMMNNFDILPQGVEIGENRVYFHRDPKMSIIDGTSHYNFDLMISDGTTMIGDSLAHEILPPKMCKVHRRYGKLEQGVLLNRIAEDDGNGNYLPVRTWLNPIKGGLGTLVNPGTKVVIKPRDGARGIGQYLVDPTKVPLNKVVGNIDALIEGTLDHPSFVQKMKSLGEGVIYSSGKEKYEGEGLDCLQGQGYLVQSYVENITAEYRLLTDHFGDIAYCQKRSIRNDSSGYPQATGSESDSVSGDDIVDIVEVLNARDLSTLRRMVKELIGPLSSIDLFVDDGFGWGVFEFCNQFGMVGVPYQRAFMLHKDYLHSLISEL